MRAIWNISHMHMAVSDADESASSDRREVSTWCANVVVSNVQLQLLLKSKHPDPAMAGCRTDKSLVQSFIGQETIPGHFQRDVITHYNIIINITWAVFLLLITWGSFLPPWSDLVKLYYIIFYLTNEKFLTTGVWWHKNRLMLLKF